jgi:hypothetical protein
MQERRSAGWRSTDPIELEEGILAGGAQTWVQIRRRLPELEQVQHWRGRDQAGGAQIRRGGADTMVAARRRGRRRRSAAARRRAAQRRGRCVGAGEEGCDGGGKRAARADGTTVAGKGRDGVAGEGRDDG